MNPPVAAAREVERGGRGEARRDATEWPHVRLGDHADKIGSGLTPNGGHAAYVDEGIPLIRSQNVHMGRFDPSGLVRITPEQDEEMSGSRVQRGDVLLNITGASIGRVCVAPDHLIPANVNQHVCIIRSDGSWHPDFLGRFLSTPGFQRFILGDQAGATRQALTKAQIEDFRIPLPPLAEQERIAGRLTEQLGAVERARAAAAQRLAAAESLPAALLREVFDGPQASGWETRTLGELLNRYNEIIHPGDRKSGEAVFVGLEHIEPHTGRRIGAGKVEFASMTGRKPTFKRGHIVYGYLRPYLNKVWVADFDGCSSVDQFAFDVNPELADTTFVAAFMRSATFLRRAQGVTTTGQLPRISIDEIAAVKIDLPRDLSTQRRLAADLGEKLAAAEGVIARCREELAAIEALPASLLRDAFGGGREAESPEGA